MRHPWAKMADFAISACYSPDPEAQNVGHNVIDFPWLQIEIRHQVMI
jgi:hypothetical protein